jgi:hypothetical protein
MYYEINVARIVPTNQTREGHTTMHFFATADRSLTDEGKAVEALRIFDRKFPASEGYSVTVSFCQHTGRDVTTPLRAAASRKPKAR